VQGALKGEELAVPRIICHTVRQKGDHLGKFDTNYLTDFFSLLLASTLLSFLLVSKDPIEALRAMSRA